MKITETCHFNIMDKTKCVEKRVRDFMVSSGILYEDYSWSPDTYSLDIVNGHRKRWLWGLIKGEIPTIRIGYMYISYNPRHGYCRNTFDTIHIELDIKEGMVKRDIFKESLINFLENCKYSDIIDFTVNLPHEKCI